MALASIDSGRLADTAPAHPPLVRRSGASCRLARVAVAALCSMTVLPVAGLVRHASASPASEQAQAKTAAEVRPAATADGSARATATAARKRARQHFLRAERLFSEKRFRDALGGYQRAYRAAPLPALLFNMAQCYRQLRQYDKAVQHYRRYLAAAPNSPFRREVRRLIQDAIGLRQRKSKDRKRERKDPGKHRERPPAPAPHAKDPPAGYARELRPTTREHAVLPGESATLSSDPAIAAQASQAADPRGPSLAALPDDLPQPAPEPINGQRPTQAPPADSSGEGSNLRVLLLGSGIGLTFAMAAAGTVTGALALHKNGEYQDPTQLPAARRDLRESGQRLSTIATATFAAAGVAAVGTTLLYFLYHPDDAPEKPLASVAPDPRGAGAHINFSTTF